jgi:ribonuclease M5
VSTEKKAEERVIKEIIVVEGRDDTAAIKRAVRAETIETRGSALSDETIEMIRQAQALRGVIVFTDPDYAGEKLRKQISSEVPGVKHAFITQAAAKGKNDIGVENASARTIREALTAAKVEWTEESDEIISWEMLVDAGLIGEARSRVRREQLCTKLGIGYCNGKQLYKRLLIFQVSEESFIKALKEIEQS